MVAYEFHKLVILVQIEASQHKPEVQGTEDTVKPSESYVSSAWGNFKCGRTRILWIWKASGVPEETPDFLKTMANTVLKYDW